MNRRVIALSGWKGSGKDTVADYLVNRYRYTKKAFASELKDSVSNMYGVPREHLDDPSKKEMILSNLPVIPTDPFTGAVHRLLSSELSQGFWTPRALCILEGSIKRAVHANYWTTTIIHDILRNENNNYVISDLRYQSEADTLKLMIPGIELVRIRRSEVFPLTNDPSERDLDNYKFHLTIDNSHGTKEQLYEIIDEILDPGNSSISITGKLPDP